MFCTNNLFYLCKAGNACFALIIYFIILLVFKKYWIVINFTVCGLIITSAVVIYCLKASNDLDSSSTSSGESSSSSDSEEETIYQAEIVSELPPSYVDIIEEVIPTAPPQPLTDNI